MSNRVSPEPVPFTDSSAPQTQNLPTLVTDEGLDDSPSPTPLQQIIEPPSSHDTEYQPRIEDQESEQVEPAATYHPPDVHSARNAKSREDGEADEKIGKSGGGDEEEDDGVSFSHPKPGHYQQREEEEEEEKEEEGSRPDSKQQSTISAGGVGGVSGSSDFPINESETSFDENNTKRARPVGRLPPLGHSDESEENSFGRLPAVTTATKMSARPNSGISRKGEQDGVIGANDSQEESGCCAIILTILSYILVILFFPFSLCLTIKVVQEYERAVIFRLGRLLPGGAKGPGIFFVMPCIEEYTKVDLRTVSFDVPPQEVLTRDSVTVSVDAVVYYRISNPTVSVANVENAANSTQLLAQTTLRNVLGTQNLAEILSNREHISEQMQNVLDDATDKWGIKVERVEIKDVRLPTQLQRAMAAEAEAARDARAKVIAAEGEQKASVALKEAADIIAGSPAALQLRYLQTLNSISAEKNSTIIFPLPIEMVAGLVKK